MNNNKLQPVRGTKDFLPEEFAIYQYIVNIAQHIAENYGYKAMTTPIFEFTEIFQRTLGDTSDVVSKEMYTFLDRGGESITLRPEFTAGIARSIISNGLFHNLPVKFFSHGPIFRYDRPQKGRFRQFHQINIEYIGNDSPYADCEIIALASNILEALGLVDDITLELNSLGDKESRDNYQNALINYFTDYYKELSEDSKIRLNKNPLRILDSKDEGDRKVIANAPLCYEYYSEYAKGYFNQVKENLDNLGIKYKVSPHLVRGLDYYSHTAFEFTTTKLGAQATVLGGGRYDGLIEIMCGKSVPAIGFAAGVERLAALINYNAEAKRPAVVIAIDDKYQPVSLELCQKLRAQDISVELAYGNDIGKKMKFVNKVNAKFAIFLGEDELSNQNYKLRNLDTREEQVIKFEDLLSQLK